MEETLTKGDETRVVRSPSELQAAIRDGWTRSVAVSDVDAFGAPRIRSAQTPEEASGAVGSGQAISLDTAAPAIEEARVREETALEADAAGEQGFAFASRLASYVPGLGNATGLDAASALDEGTREIFRDRTQGAEMGADLAMALNPFGAEAMAARGIGMLTRGASWGVRAGGLALEGAVGGAAYEMAEAGTEGNLDDVEERLGSSMGFGAAFGGGLGVLGAGGRAMRRRLRRGGNSLRQEVAGVATEAASTGPMTATGLPAGRAPDSLLGRVSDATTSSTDVLGVDISHRATQEAADRFANRGLASHENIVGGIGELVDTARTLRSGLSDLGDLPPIMNSAGTSLRAGVRELQEGVLDSAARRLGVTAGNPVSAAMDGVVDALRRSDPLERSQALFQAAHGVDEVVRVSRREGQEGLNALAVEASTGLRGIIADFDPTGNMGQRLDRMDKLRDFQRRLGGKVGEDSSIVNLLDEGVTVDAAAIRGIVDHAGSAASNNVPKLEQLQALREMAQYVGAVEGTTLARKGNLEVLERSLTDTIRDAHAHSALETALGREGRAAGGPLALAQAVPPGMAAMAGFAAAGPVGGLVAGVGTAVAGAFIRKPVGINRTMNRLRSRFGAQSQRLTTAVQSGTKSLSSKLRTPFRAVRAQPGTIGAILMNSSAQDKRESYSAMVARVEELTSNPAMLASIAEEESRFADTIDPSLPGRMSMGLMRRMGALRGALPRSRRGNSMRSMTPPPIPSMVEVSEFLQVAAVVEDPVFGVELMQSGRLSVAAARAISQSYPRFHAQVTAAYMSEIATIHQGGGRLNYQMALQVSRFAGFPLDSTMEPSFQAALSDQSAQTTEQESAQFSRPVSTREPSSLRNEATVLSRMQR